MTLWRKTPVGVDNFLQNMRDLNVITAVTHEEGTKAEPEPEPKQLKEIFDWQGADGQCKRTKLFETGDDLCLKPDRRVTPPGFVVMWTARRSRWRPENRSVETRRAARRQLEAALRKARREQLLVSKRFLQESEEDEEGWDGGETGTELLSQEEVFQLLKSAQCGLGEKISALRHLRCSLRHREGQLHFIRLEKSMQMLLGLFTGRLAAVQMEAARCLQELTQSEESSVAVACLPATPYLLTYLSGQSAKFTELCLYILGNLSAESEAVRRHLLIQGIIPALHSCIQSPHAAVVEAVGYTLSQLLQAKEAPETIIPLVLESGITCHLLRLIDINSEIGLEATVECAWCLHYIVCSRINNVLLVSQAMVHKCSSALVELSKAVSTSADSWGLELLIVPLLRCLGNLLGSTETAECGQQIQDGRLLTALCIFVSSFLQQRPFVVRESLWLLNNLTAHSPLLCSALLYLKLIPSLLQLLTFSSEINTLVLRLLCNIAVFGPQYCQQLQQAKVLPAISATLKMADPEVVSLTLELLNLIFVYCPEAAGEFVNQNGAQDLEMIQYNFNQEIRVQASALIETHISKYREV
ncbi:transmembrane and coiled-coil domain-containing protein 6 [Latimeria chalumnae]|uniref:transmembrane and coiled-coil domain-containing protein 6 n=1 Tax=Latimeria chalumnae TaxID=7897 RepID=UPI00313D459A